MAISSYTEYIFISENTDENIIEVFYTSTSGDDSQEPGNESQQGSGDSQEPGNDIQESIDTMGNLPINLSSSAKTDFKKSFNYNKAEFYNEFLYSDYIICNFISQLQYSILFVYSLTVLRGHI